MVCHVETTVGVLSSIRDGVIPVTSPGSAVVRKVY